MTALPQTLIDLQAIYEYRASNAAVARARATMVVRLGAKGMAESEEEEMAERLARAAEDLALIARQAVIDAIRAL